jgi:hypothetical protein
VSGNAFARGPGCDRSTQGSGSIMPSRLPQQSTVGQIFAGRH